MTQNEIVKYARSWLGTKWRHEGRGELGQGDPRSGIDCAGLLVVTAKEFGLPYSDIRGYGRNPEPVFLQAIEENTDQGYIDGPLHGAIGIFSDTINACHTGIFSHVGDELTVIHSEAWPSRRCIEEEFEGDVPSLKDRLVDIRLFKGIIYV